ncbi:hypothetical protein GJAV_G00228840 [Gymnothorax javanicus]|nr:hypothetical protein GJAV_G00228840 [Gymnothorax javanicus]
MGTPREILLRLLAWMLLSAGLTVQQVQQQESQGVVVFDQEQHISRAGARPAHNGQVCSTWGYYNFKTFDGNTFQVPTECNYILTSHCHGNYEEFNIQIRRKVVDGVPIISKIVLRLDGTAVSLTKGSIRVEDNEVSLPYAKFGVGIMSLNPYIRVRAKLGVTVSWNEEDSVMVVLDKKFMNQTCGLCGDFNGIQDFNEFHKDGVQLSAADYATIWKFHSPNEQCEAPEEPPTPTCFTPESQLPSKCIALLNSSALSSCMELVDRESLLQACEKDLCISDEGSRTFCTCATIAELSRLCVHAGGHPQQWRTPEHCYQVTIFKPSTFYMIAQTIYGLQLRIQIIPVMQVYITLNPSQKGTTAGLCGNYNNVQSDDFLSPDGLVESTAITFANSWKSRTNCPVIKNIFENPCSLSVENEVYANSWCSKLTDPNGVFSECHSAVDPDSFKAQCIYDSCNCERSEDCMCAALSAYVVACVAEGIKLDGWRDDACEKYTACPSTLVFGYDMTSCKRTCRSLSEPDYSCQDYCGNNGTFRVITENQPCGTTGTTCSKAIKLFLGKNELVLSDATYQVIERDTGSEIPYSIRTMGIYMVIEASNGVMLIWDKRTSLFVKLSPKFEGRVCGLCGNYDHDGKNDFTTKSKVDVTSALEFGNSWKVSSTCPNAVALKNPCASNPYRQSWSQKQCSIINSKVFSACHAQVDPVQYYDACVHDACACDSGGDCECFCTAVAAYAQACNEAGVCVAWRTPRICPLFCDYYNGPDECEWHYRPCGASCMKTCRNPTAICSTQIPALEGCYPKCPEDKPYFNEATMKCVPSEDCGCYDEEGNHYNDGQEVPTKENCKR